MKEKIVMTEKGYKIHNDILLASINDDLPPFIEDAKQMSTNTLRRPSQQLMSMGGSTSQPTMRLANLFENSNGYLDRFTLKSAQSNRPQSIVKPFFLPEYSFKEVLHNNPKQAPAKYPGIYPPPPKTAGAIPSSSNRRTFSSKMSSMQQQQHQTGTVASKSNGFMHSTNHHHPLVLDYESIASPPMTAPGSSQGIGVIAEFTSLRQQQQQQQQRNFKQDDFQLKTGRTVGFGGFGNTRENMSSSPFEDSPERGLNFGMRTNNQQLQHTGSMWNSGTIVNFNLTSQSSMPKKQYVVVDKQAYQKSLRERMDVKKANYLQERETQEKKLKELVAAKHNLSKDPVHIAAAYLQDLKKVDEHVEELAFDVKFQKKRYKERLSEYHHHKYEKSWGKLALPQNRKKLPKIVRIGVQNMDDLDEDTLDNQANTNNAPTTQDLL